jgi:hypothetical protein
MHKTCAAAKATAHKHAEARMVKADATKSETSANEARVECRAYESSASRATCKAHAAAHPAAAEASPHSAAEATAKLGFKARRKDRNRR